MSNMQKKGGRFLLVYLLFFSGVIVIAFFVRSGIISFIRGILSISAWLLLFVLAKITSRSAENRRLLEIDEKERQASVSRIKTVVSKINEKALALNDSYFGEKQVLSDLAKAAAALLPSTNLEASKMEYEILTGLTRLDFLCDKAIAGTDGSGDFKKELDLLSVKLRARERL